MIFSIYPSKLVLLLLASNLLVITLDAAGEFQSAMKDMAAKVKGENEEKCMKIVMAARSGDEQVLKGENTMEINCKDKYGYTPAHHAARKGKCRFLQAMIEMKADLNLKNNNGWTALDEAAYWGQYKAVKLLLKAGSNPNSKNGQGQTSLHLASQGQLKRAGKITSVLIKAGGDVNAVDKKGWVPLHYAVENLQKSAAKKLLQAGSNPNTKGGKTKISPLELADSADHLKVMVGVLENVKNAKDSL